MHFSQIVQYLECLVYKCLDFSFISSFVLIQLNLVQNNLAYKFLTACWICHTPDL